MAKFSSGMLLIKLRLERALVYRTKVFEIIAKVTPRKVTFRVCKHPHQTDLTRSKIGMGPLIENGKHCELVCGQTRSRFPTHLRLPTSLL